LYVCVKWNECFSSCRNILAGVGQGGVLSPTLFGIYINDILVLLQTHQHGCWVFGRFVGLLMYTDDLVLLSITLGDLRSMLHNVCLELSWLDMKLNMKNSHMLRIGPRCNVNISPVTVHGLLLSITNDMCICRILVLIFLLVVKVSCQYIVGVCSF